MNDLFLLALNLTRRCNLACAHCYLDAGTLKDGVAGELSVSEVCDILNEAAVCGPGAMIVLTGGEPLLRNDIEQIVEHGADLGLGMVIGTNGMALTESRVRSLKDAGTMGVGISVDSLEPASHDEFRGLDGAWHKTMQGIENCRKIGLPFQIHFSVTRQNVDELDAMIDFSRNVGAMVLNIFFLVCTGRGETMTDISPQKYDDVMGEIIDAQAKYDDIIIRARCAPHFKRVAFQRAPDNALNRISGMDGDGCIAASHYVRVTAEGAVTPCPYIEDVAGNTREQSFSSIWKNSELLEEMRNPKLEGKCGACEFRALCGGCRARAGALNGSLMAEDPWCVYEPVGGALIEPFNISERNAVVWSVEAEARLERIPAFLRKLVRKRATAYVSELGETTVTPDHLSKLAARRFGNTPFQRPEL